MKGRDKFMEVLTMNKKIMFTRFMNIVSMIVVWLGVAQYVYDGLSVYTWQSQIGFAWLIYLGYHFTRIVVSYFRPAKVVVTKNRNFVTFDLNK